MTDADWYRVKNVAQVPSPTLLVYPDRVEENVRRAIAIAGGPERLWPHVKTHKMEGVLAIQRRHGIETFKVATIAEAELTAQSGAREVLLAYPLVGPNVERFVALTRLYPETKFLALADNEDAIRKLSEALGSRPSPSLAEGDSEGNEQGVLLAEGGIEVLLDLNVGMNRTGVAPSELATKLYRMLATLPNLIPGGLHAYDGHLTMSDPVERERAVEAAHAPAFVLSAALIAEGLPVPRYIAGGSPTFSIHAKNPTVSCSPGTFVFWDSGYTPYPDLDFLPAALVLTRVISQLDGGRLCLDLGYKAIASEQPQPRVKLLGLENAELVGHSEEHLVVETPRASEFPVGTEVFGIPRHICPTVALYDEAITIIDGKAAGRWPILGRRRRLSV